MSEQQYQGTLASGGTFIADSQGIRILDPAGNQLASFGRDVISGINRDGQVVTVERHNDTIVTLTTASITDAVGLEQFVRDTIVAPPAPEPPTAEPPPPPEPDPSPPLAFDAFDDDAADEESPPPPPPSEPPAAPRPPIISRPETDDEEVVPPAVRHDLPEPVPTAPRLSQPSASEATERIPDAPPPPTQPPPPSYEASAAPPPPPVTSVDAGEEKGGRRWWLWGCLGCGGLLILAIICIAVVLATSDIDWDEITGEEETPTPFILVATQEPTEPDESGDGGDSGPSTGEVMNAGESGTLGGMTVTFLGSRTDDSGLVDPDEGNEYLLLNFRIENTNPEPVTVSTLLQFELQDQSGTDFPIALFAETSESLDTEVPAGGTVEGEVAFEVPQGGGPYTVSYTDFLSDEPLQWAVN